MEIVLAFFATITFGIIALLLSIEKGRERKRFLREDAMQKDKLYKASILLEIQNRTAYLPDTEQVIDIIMEALRKLFPYSTASSMVIKNKSVIFKTYIEEQISKEYLQKIKESMLFSISSLGQTLPEGLEERVYGVSLNGSTTSVFNSSFHIPLITANKVAALIHLSSTKPQLYKDKDMEVLYQIMEQAGARLSEFRHIVEVEQNKLTSFAKSLKDGIFTVDNKNNLLLINSSAIKILNLSKPNIIFFDIVNALPSKLELAFKINSVILNNTPYHEKETKINDKIIDIFISPLEENKVSVVLHDITEDKHTASLKEDFTHIMVHELRAPITTIKDSSELIITTYDSLEKEKQLKFLQIIHSQSKTLLDQISSILDTAKLDAGRFTIQKTEGDIGKLIKEEIQTFLPQAAKKHIDLTYDILNPLPLIYFDPIRITQVVNNLLSNSLKFTADGGRVKLEIDYKTMPNVLKSDKFIIVSVSDNGIGIPIEQQKYLFSKFSQAKATPEKLAKLGTGLGLYVVKGIIEAHGGKVWVKSVPTQGTTISFSLPAEGTDVKIPKTSQDLKDPITSIFGKTIN